MKKKLLLSVAFFGAAVGVGSPASAAPPTPLPMMYNWTGCYIGANAGYSWGRGSADVNALSLGFPFGANFDMNGFIGGGQVGCNWQSATRSGDWKRIFRVPRRRAAALLLSTSVRARLATTSRQSFGGLEPCGHELASWLFRRFCFTGRADLPTATSR